MAKNKGRTRAGNNNSGSKRGNNTGTGVQCSYCRKNSHNVGACYSNPQNQNKKSNNNNNNNNMNGGKSSKWCTHCNKDNHNIDICKFKNQGPNSNQKSNRQNCSKWCEHCSMKNHNTVDCNKKNKSGSSKNDKAPSRICSHCGDLHFDSSCPSLVSNPTNHNLYNFGTPNPEHANWDSSILNSTYYAPAPVIPANPFASIICAHCQQREHPASKCPYSTHQAKLNAAQTTHQLTFQSQFPQTHAPMQTAMSGFQQTVYRNPLINAADSDDGNGYGYGCMAYRGQLLLSGMRMEVQDGRFPALPCMVDRDGDVVMEHTAYWVASVREGFAAWGGGEDDEMEID